MALCGKIHAESWFFLLEEPQHSITVTDIALHKAERRVVTQGGEMFKAAGIGELVEADEPHIRMACTHMEQEGRADEAGTARHENGHEKAPASAGACLFMRRIIPAPPVS